jgi:hypothetical protein
MAIPSLTTMLNEARVGLTQKLRFLYPDSTESVEDAIIKSYYDTWASTARAIDAFSHPEAHKPMLPLPPDEEEYRPCRAMWAVTVERIISGEDVACYELRAVLDFMASTKSWYEHEDCACKTSGWRGYEIREALTIHYLDSVRAENAGLTINELCDRREAAAAAAAAAASSLAEEKAKRDAKPSWAFVKCHGLTTHNAEPVRIHDTLFGYYTVTQTPDHYIFTLMQPMHPDDVELIGTKTIVPLSYAMGEGDFECVTPDKIVKT